MHVSLGNALSNRLFDVLIVQLLIQIRTIDFGSISRITLCAVAFTPAHVCRGLLVFPIPCGHS